MKSSWWLAAVAAFVGVFGALQLDHFMLRARPGLGADSAPPALLETPKIMPVDMEPMSTGMVDFRLAAKKVMPSVVSVDKYQRVVQGFFGEDTQVAQTATGSGVIVSSDGYIVTNNHVVAGAVEVRVHTSDKHIYQAQIVGADPRSDLAVLKIKAGGLRPIELGNSDALEVGQWVLAVGNPLGFDNTVSQGVVSSLKRHLPVENGELLNAIQTDAAINPGNSGGALADLKGRLIGINSAIASGTGQSVGIGFAIPVNRVQEVFNDIVRYGHARYGDLGIRVDQSHDGWLAVPEVRRQIAQITNSSDVPSEGVIIHVDSDDNSPSVLPGSGAYRAGIRDWDVLLEINGQPVPDAETINRLLTPMKPGQVVTVKYWSHGDIHVAKVTLSEVEGI